jgi:hypothetical protein
VEFLICRFPSGEILQSIDRRRKHEVAESNFQSAKNPPVYFQRFFSRAAATL